MPHLRFRALPSESVQALSASLPAELARIMQTGEDNFTFESIATQFFNNAAQSESYPFVEVLWFARTSEVQKQSALAITSQIKALGGYADVVVIFVSISKTDYFENGEHF